MKSKQTILIVPKYRKYKPLKKRDIRVVREDEWKIWYNTAFYFIKKKWETPRWILNQRINIIYGRLSIETENIP